MGKLKIPQQGEIKKAKITDIRLSTAGEQFTNAAGEFKGKFSKREDPVFVLYAMVEGEKQERKIGTFNKPQNETIAPSSKLFKLLQTLGISEVSDDLRELRGKTVSLVTDAKGFSRLP
jgi:hypothetical protein